MSPSIRSALTFGLALFSAAEAHVWLTNIYFNDVTPGDGVCIRNSRDGNKRNSPIPDITSTDMVCGFDGTEPVSRTCPGNAGDKLTLGWFTLRDEDLSGAHLDPSHKGPCSVMMKKVESANVDSGVGDGWFNIFYEGFNNETGKWCSERMFDKGKISTQVPDDLAAGDYLIRAEIIGLQAAQSPEKHDPQPYVNCAQVFIKSAGNAVPKDTVSIPSNYVNMDMPAMNWNIYVSDEQNSEFPDYGPAVYKSSGQVSGQGNQVQTKGLKPDNCVLEDGNWCGLEVPDYNSQGTCWDSVKNCWDQGQECWTFSVGYDGCNAWAKKCEALSKECENKNWTGPPNKGQQLTHPGSGRKASCPPIVGGSSPSGTSSSGSNEASYEEVKSEPSSSSSTSSAAPTDTQNYERSEESLTKEETVEPVDEQKYEEMASVADTSSSSAAISQDSQPTSTAATAPAYEAAKTETPVAEAPVQSSCPATVTETVHQTITATVTAQPTAVQAAANGEECEEEPKKEPKKERTRGRHGHKHRG